MKCYCVKCIDENGTSRSIGVMAENEDKAKAAAEKSILEGLHVRTNAVEASETEGI